MSPIISSSALGHKLPTKWKKLSLEIKLYEIIILLLLLTWYTCQ